MNYCLIIFSCLLLFANEINAQTFSKGHHASMQANQIVIDNYTSITLKNGNKSLSNINQFDSGNPYSYFQNIQDENDKIYQVLYQTDFWGNVLFLAYSNNLNEAFNGIAKPLYRFLSCIETVNASDFPTENIERAVNCIIERLNYCREY